MEVCRIEMWKINNNETTDDIYDELYFIAKTDNGFYWFDACLDIIPSPFIGKDYNLRPFGKIFNSRTNGTFKANTTTEFDIIFNEEGIIPYNKHEDIDYKELLWKLLVQRGYEKEDTPQ